MNPEGVPLHGVWGSSGYEGYPAQPGGPTVIKSTTVNIVTEHPKDHIIWSLCCFVYCNPFCLGLAALIYSIKSRDRKMVGDLEGARRHGSTARKLNIASSILIGLAFLTYIIIMVSCIVYYNQRHNNRFGL